MRFLLLFSFTWFAFTHQLRLSFSHGIQSHGCLSNTVPLALVTEKVTESVRNALDEAGWGIVAVDTITSNHPSVVEERWRDNYSKIHLFALLVPTYAFF
jgi:hypothetical protein